MAQVDGLRRGRDRVGDRRARRPAGTPTSRSTDADATASSRCEAAGGAGAGRAASTFGDAGRMAVFADPGGRGVPRLAGRQLRTARSSSTRPARGTGATSRPRDAGAREGLLRRGLRLGVQRRSTSASDPSDDDPRPGLRRAPRGARPGHARPPRSSARPRASPTRSAGWSRRPARTARLAGHLTFTVADADETAARTAELGGTVLVEPFDVPWPRWP